MDAVILAGGKSERLRGIVPPYHKPFIVVNGKSLLVTAVDSAREAGAERIVVVATGENALPVWQLVGHRSEVRVVLSDRGVGDAVYRGLEVCVEDRVLVLMSDNVHGENDVVRVTCGGGYGIGVRDVPWTEAERFTRQQTGRWVEGPWDHDLSEAGWHEYIRIWCGPLVINRERGLKILEGKGKIGPHLDDLAPFYDHVKVTTQDIGVPDAVAKITRS